MWTWANELIGDQSLKLHLSRLQGIWMSLTGREEVWKGVLSNSMVSMLLTEGANSVLRNRLIIPRKKLFECLVVEILRA